MSRWTEDDLTARAQERIGEVLCGKYRLERVLGVGEIAAVYRAVHRDGRLVAIKVLHAHLSRSARVRERFLREGLAVNAVKHPGVVEVIDHDVAANADGSAFLVMELLSGQSLDEICATSAHLLNMRSVLALALELCAVLAAAHRAAIVHRDIKPGNLFVTDAGRLKVLDFGMAGLCEVSSSSTPAFMAPEQANGRASKIDARTDVWAVGATMFALLSGRLVHEGATAQHAAVLAATQPARLLMTVAPDVPVVVAEIVDRALARDQASRWQSAAEMWTAIDRARRQLAHENQVSVAAPNVPLRALMAQVLPRRLDRMAMAPTLRGLGPSVPSSFALPPVGVRMRTTTTPPVRRRGAARFALPIAIGIALVATWLSARHSDAGATTSTTTTSAAVVTAASSVAPPAATPIAHVAIVSATTAPSASHGVAARPPTRRGSATPTHSAPSRPIAGASAR